VGCKNQKKSEAEKQLVNQGFTIYLPTFKKEHHNKHVVKVKTMPLFPRYLFIKNQIIKQK
jgi:hypothetical protein